MQFGVVYSTRVIDRKPITTMDNEDPSRTQTCDGGEEQQDRNPEVVSDLAIEDKVKPTSKALSKMLEPGEIVNVHLWPNHDGTLNVKGLKVRLYGHMSKHPDATYVISVAEIRAYYDPKNPKSLAKRKRDDFTSMIREFLKRPVVAEAVASRFGGQMPGFYLPGLDFDGLEGVVVVARKAKFIKKSTEGARVVPLLPEDDFSFKECDGSGVKRSIFEAYLKILHEFPKGKLCHLSEALHQLNNDHQADQKAIVQSGMILAQEEAEEVREFYEEEHDQQQKEIAKLHEVNAQQREVIAKQREEIAKLRNGSQPADEEQLDHQRAEVGGGRKRSASVAQLEEQQQQQRGSSLSAAYRKFAESIASGHNFENVIVRVCVHMMKDLLPTEYLAKRRKIAASLASDPPPDWLKWRDLRLLLSSDKLRLHDPPIPEDVIECCDAFCKASDAIARMSGVTTRSQSKI